MKGLRQMRRLAFLLMFTAGLFPIATAAEDLGPYEELRAAGEYLAGQSRFAFDSIITYQGTYAGDTELLATDFRVAFERPSGISASVANREIEIAFFSNGVDYIRHIPEFEQYIRQDIEYTPEEVIKTSGFDLIVPALDVVSALVTDHPFSGAPRISEASYIGVEKVGDVQCHRIHLTYDAVPADIWIETGDRPLIRQIVPDMTAMEEEYEGRTGLDFEISVVAEFQTWTFDEDLSDRLAFTPPDATQEVAAFQAPRPPSPAEALAGETAPDFTLALLDGGSLTLSEKRGKEIVILDFWATWCGPCRIAMPVLSEVSKEFADKNVRLYGVNLEEDPETIRAYLDKQGLDVTVALDTDHSVAALYKVSGIPQTVIVGLDGKVAEVHVGLWAVPSADKFGPDTTEDEQMAAFHEVLAESLREQLNAIIDDPPASD